MREAEQVWQSRYMANRNEALRGLNNNHWHCDRREAGQNSSSRRQAPGIREAKKACEMGSVVAARMELFFCQRREETGGSTGCSWKAGQSAPVDRGRGSEGGDAALADPSWPEPGGAHGGGEPGTGPVEEDGAGPREWALHRRTRDGRAPGPELAAVTHASGCNAD